jgi:ribonuclease P protein component
VYQSGRRQFTGNMTVFFLRRSSGPEATVAANTPRVGFTVGKVLGGAVERNRIKRRMREAVRLSAQACEGPIDVVFNPRKSVSKVPFAELVNEVTRALRLAAQRARTGEQR